MRSTRTCSSKVSKNNSHARNKGVNSLRSSKSWSTKRIGRGFRFGLKAYSQKRRGHYGLNQLWVLTRHYCTSEVKLITDLNETITRNSTKCWWKCWMTTDMKAWWSSYEASWLYRRLLLRLLRNSECSKLQRTKTSSTMIGWSRREDW